ncbi:hypothetical protein [Frankia sp. AgB32]|uniref:hypothetical protein n=1 Tax=Frankia sp. AgB32 TaxID=631119 RepID=UPI00200BC554|nr:hypothetical protein [Frankia sp. AgB32]MCK9897670.1 hypothetical protein [Frankia sp. AgB32]
MSAVDPAALEQLPRDVAGQVLDSGAAEMMCGPREDGYRVGLVFSWDEEAGGQRPTAAQMDAIAAAINAAPGLLAALDTAERERDQALVLAEIHRQERDAEMAARFTVIKKWDTARGEATRLARVVREQEQAAGQAARAAAVAHQAHVDAAVLLVTERDRALAALGRIAEGDEPTAEERLATDKLGDSYPDYLPDARIIAALTPAALEQGTDAAARLNNGENHD